MTFIQSCQTGINKGCIVIKNAADIFSKALVSTAQKVYEVIKVFIKFAVTVISIFGFPGAFIAGITVGVVFPKYVNETVETISRIWERQSWLTCGGILFMFAYGLPYTPYMAAFLCGAQIGSFEALNSTH